MVATTPETASRAAERATLLSFARSMNGSATNAKNGPLSMPTPVGTIPEERRTRWSLERESAATVVHADTSVLGARGITTDDLDDEMRVTRDRLFQLERIEAAAAKLRYQLFRDGVPHRALVTVIAIIRCDHGDGNGSHLRIEGIRRRSHEQERKHGGNRASHAH